MGFVGMFNLAIRCFDLLAWPLLALGYPLRASIMAIEKNSDLETRKLFTYWIIFSLISLFEHVFVNLLERIPLWVYIKLMIVCWLMIPHFDGSYYVYVNVVRPCLSIETQTFIEQLKKLKEISFERKDFSIKRGDLIDKVEKFVGENRPEALDDLIASKSKFEDVTHKDIKAVEATEDKKADVAKLSKFKDVTQKDIKAVETIEDKKSDIAKPSSRSRGGRGRSFSGCGRDGGSGHGRHTCNHCGCVGHIMAKCWDLHGHPTGPMANTVQTNPVVGLPLGRGDDSGVYISQEAYPRLVQHQGSLSPM